MHYFVGDRRNQRPTGDRAQMHIAALVNLSLHFANTLAILPNPTVRCLSFSRSICRQIASRTGPRAL